MAKNKYSALGGKLLKALKNDFGLSEKKLQKVNGRLQNEFNKYSKDEYGQGARNSIQHGIRSGILDELRYKENFVEKNKQDYTFDLSQTSDTKEDINLLNGLFKDITFNKTRANNYFKRNRPSETSPNAPNNPSPPSPPPNNPTPPENVEPPSVNKELPISEAPQREALPEQAGPAINAPTKSPKELKALEERQRENIPTDTTFGGKPAPQLTKEQMKRMSRGNQNDPGLDSDVEKYNHGATDVPLKENTKTMESNSQSVNNAQGAATVQAKADTAKATKKSDNPYNVKNEELAKQLQGILDEHTGDNEKLSGPMKQFQNRMQEKLNRISNMTPEQVKQYADKHEGRSIHDDVSEQMKSGPSMGDYFYGYHGPTAVGIGLGTASVLSLANSRGQKSNAELYSDPFA